MRHRFLTTLARDANGATLIEFAMILPALCVLLLGVLELGYRSYASSVLQGVLQEAARMATVGGVTQTQIDNRVRQRLAHFAQTSTVQIATKSYQEYSDAREGEPFTVDTAPFNVVNSGDCWRDYINVGTHDASFSGRAGLGGAEDVVRYEVSLTYPSILPVASFMGWSSTQTITMDTMLRNQPYAGRTTVPITCRP